MRERQAKILSEADIRRLLRVAQRSKSPIRNSVIVLLSVRAGLRAGEIAKLEWHMVVDAAGRVGNLITLPGSIVIHRESRGNLCRRYSGAPISRAI